jgi:GTPase
MTTRRRAPVLDPWKLIGAVGVLLISIGAWWAVTTWDRIATAEDRSEKVRDQVQAIDKRQERLEAVVEQQNKLTEKQQSFNEKLLEVLNQRANTGSGASVTSTGR